MALESYVILQSIQAMPMSTDEYITDILGLDVPVKDGMYQMTPPMVVGAQGYLVVFTDNISAWYDTETFHKVTMKVSQPAATMVARSEK